MVAGNDTMTEEERLAARWASLADEVGVSQPSLQILNQDEIDSLLGFEPEIPSAERYERFIARLIDPQPPPEESQARPYGMFEPDATMMRFFDDPGGENILADIRDLNRRHGVVPITIPGTKIELLNFSKCPRCGRLHSATELASRYAQPPRRAGVPLRKQLRQDTCVSCIDCGVRFQPGLVIIDGTPKAERQYLCRVQTAAAIEDFHTERWQRPVLGRKAANRLSLEDGLVGIRNDVTAGDLAERPTLLANLLQYTPASLALRFLAGDNRDHDDLLFGQAWPC
ncbi:MAG: hypothetical protein WCF85_15245 [Rhodospirillaceae bacterium]